MRCIHRVISILASQSPGSQSRNPGDKGGAEGSSGLPILASSKVGYHLSITYLFTIYLFYHLSVLYLASCLCMPDNSVVQSQHKVIETAIHQKI